MKATWKLDGNVREVIDLNQSKLSTNEFEFVENILFPELRILSFGFQEVACTRKDSRKVKKVKKKIQNTGDDS